MHTEENVMDNASEQVSPAGHAGGRALFLRWVSAHVTLFATTWSVTYWLSATSWYGVYALFTLPLAIVAPFVAQWFGIRQVLEQRRETRIWIAVTVVPWLVVSVLVVAVATNFGTEDAAALRWLLSIVLALAGSFLGLAQWSVLQRHVSRALWWIPANALGVMGGALIGMFLSGSLSTLCRSTATVAGFPDGGLRIGACRLLETVLGFLIGSAVFSIITGVTLAWLVSRQSES
jgi:hypothetical protein